MKEINVYITEKLKINKDCIPDNFDEMNEDAFDQIKVYFDNREDIKYEIKYNTIYKNYVMYLKFKKYPQYLKETSGQNKFLKFLETTDSKITGELLIKDGIKDVYFCDDKWIAIILQWFRK